MTDNDVPNPEDPEFFAKYTAPQAIRDFAFGPEGGTPPPRVTRPLRRPESSRTTPARTSADQSPIQEAT